VQEGACPLGQDEAESTGIQTAYSRSFGFIGVDGAKIEAAPILYLSKNRKRLDSQSEILILEKRSYASVPAMPLNKQNISNVSVQFEKHQPERRRGVGGNLLCCGGCCCCCCCLHSLGGLIGAAAATAKSRSPSGGSGVGCYWTVLTLLTVVIFAWASAGAEVPGGVIIALLFLPLAQLVASILTFIWIAIRSADFPDKKASLQTIPRITLWSLLGAVVGLVAMIVGFKMFRS